MSAMRILSLWQPWASLIALGLKQYETRSWGTDYRGRLAIHATKRLLDETELALLWKLETMTGRKLNPVDFKYPTGAIVAIADLTQCSEMTSLPAVNPPWHQISLNTTCSGLTPLELAVGGWADGRYAWKLESVRSLDEPIPYKGGQGLRWLDDAPTLKAIAVRLGDVVRCD